MGWMVAGALALCFATVGAFLISCIITPKSPIMGNTEEHKYAPLDGEEDSRGEEEETDKNSVDDSDDTSPPGGLQRNVYPVPGDNKPACAHAFLGPESLRSTREQGPQG